MVTVDVRRLAAIDMYGLHGTRRRRRIILAEFLAGAGGGLAIGLVLLLAGSHAAFNVALGAWVLGIGVNYVPLALYAIQFSRPGKLEAELDGADIRAELRHYTVMQFWIAIPALFAVLSVAQSARRR
jgi:hypothetical protein